MRLQKPDGSLVPGGQQGPTEEEILQHLAQQQQEDKNKPPTVAPQALVKQEDSVGGAIANLTQNFFDMIMADLEVSGGVTGVALAQDGSIHVFVMTEHYMLLVTQKYKSYEGREVKPVIKTDEEVIDAEATQKESKATEDI